jgi:hypothetical protein
MQPVDPAIQHEACDCCSDNSPRLAPNGNSPVRSGRRYRGDPASNRLRQVGAMSAANAAKSRQAITSLDAAAAVPRIAFVVRVGAPLNHLHPDVIQRCVRAAMSSSANLHHFNVQTAARFRFPTPQMLRLHLAFLTHTNNGKANMPSGRRMAQRATAPCS